MFRIITWNVNSVRKRIEHLCNVLSSNDIDVALLQEIKCTDEQFPFEQLKSIGYSCLVNGQKSRNGVAIISRIPVTGVTARSVFGGESDVKCAGSYAKDESRYLECSMNFYGKTLRIISVYVPNGQEVDTDTFEYKLHFLDCLRVRLLSILETDSLLIMGGDYNVAPESIDVYDDKLLDGRLCFHVRERAKLREIFNCGFIDIFRTVAGEEKQEFSWWNYREGAWQNNRGMRIDGFISSPHVADMVQECSIMSKVRGWDSPSDHAPVMCCLKAFV
ncbi:MAG: exodeoxyribonuclease III [Aaplasma endosymbiont of Hyalomma asiaticum]